MNITQSQFRDFLDVRDSGKTNMFDSQMVADLSLCLNPEDVKEIIRNFDALEKKYGQAIHVQAVKDGDADCKGCAYCSEEAMRVAEMHLEKG